MKILEANACALSNFEVLNFLQSRGATTNPARVLIPIAPSEFKVYDYLVESAACKQTKENVGEFLEKCRQFKLAKAEILNIINVRPSSLVEIDSIIEQSDTRFGDELQELVDLILEVLPPHPNEPRTEEENNEDKEGTTDDKKVDEDKKETADGVGIDVDNEKTAAGGSPMDDS